MSKNVSFEEAEVLDEEVIPDEETTALANRANMGEFLDSPSTVNKINRPDFIRVSKDTANATIGKENFQLLKAGESTDVVIFRIDGLAYMKSDKANPMAAPIKFENAEAAIAAGERIHFTPEGDKPTVDPYRNIAMLIKCPGDANPAFGIELAEDDWATGIYSCSRTAYFQNMKDDEGILKTIRFYLKNGTPLYQLLWTVQPVLHRYDSGFTAGYLKFTLKKKLDDKDPIFIEIQDALIGGQ